MQRRIGGEQRWVPLPAQAWDAIQDYLGDTGRWPRMGADEVVFAPLKYEAQHPRRGQAGDWAGDRPLSFSQCHKLLKKYARWAGLGGENVTMHTLRNTAAMLQMQAGGGAHAIQVFLGNKSSRATGEYLRRLVDSPPPPTGDPPQPTRDLSIPPPRGKVWVKPGEQLGLLHGFSAKSLPADEVAAVLAEDIKGLDEEISGLRTLSRALLAKGKQVDTNDELVKLSAAYLMAADRQRVMIVAVGKMEGSTEGDDWPEALLAMLDNFAQEMGEEPVSQETREMAAESDPGMTLVCRRLTEEVATARLVLRNTYLLAIEPQTVKEQLRYTEVYGRGCIRLVRLLKSEGAAQGSLADFLRKEIEETILEVNREWDLDLPG